jgi:protein TonB
MFQESLVESSALLRTQNRWPAAASIALQLMLVAVFMAVPLLYPEALSWNASKLTSLAPPALRPTPPPPPQHVQMVTAAEHTSSLAPPTQAPRLQHNAFLTDAHAVEAPALALGTTGIPGNNSLSDLYSRGPATPSIAVTGPAARSTTAAPVNISSGVIAGLLVEPIRPVYPPIARISHTEGSVVVQAIISKSGHIESAHVLSGPAMFYAAALAAVQQARYRPYLLNREPTEVETTITINFRFGN